VTKIELWELVRKAMEGGIRYGAIFTAPICPIRLEIQYTEEGFIYHYIEFYPELIGKPFELKNCNMHEFVEIEKEDT